MKARMQTYAQRLRSLKEEQKEKQRKSALLKDKLLSLSGCLYVDLETVPNRVANDEKLRVKPTVKWEKHESQPQWSFPTVCTIMCGNDILVIDNLAIFFDQEVKRHLTSLPIVGHNIFFDLAHLLYQYDMRWPNNKIFCTLIAEKCLIRGLGVKSDLWSSLKRRRIVNLFNETDEQKVNWLQPLTDSKIKYCKQDVQYLPRLMKEQLKLLKKNDLFEPMFSHIETMNEVVLDMQLNGLPVDFEYADRYYGECMSHCDILKRELTEEVLSIEEPVPYIVEDL